MLQYPFDYNILKIISMIVCIDNLFRATYLYFLSNQVPLSPLLHLPSTEYLHLMPKINFTFVLVHFSTTLVIIHWGWHSRWCFPIWKILMKPIVGKSQISCETNCELICNFMWKVTLCCLLPSSQVKWREASTLLSNSSSMVTTIATIPSEVGISEGVSWFAFSENNLNENLLFAIPAYRKLAWYFGCDEVEPLLPHLHPGDAFSRQVRVDGGELATDGVEVDDLLDGCPHLLNVLVLEGILNRILALVAPSRTTSAVF